MGFLEGEKSSLCHDGWERLIRGIVAEATTVRLQFETWIAGSQYIAKSQSLKPSSL